MDEEAIIESSDPLFEPHTIGAQTTPHLEFFGGSENVSKGHLNVCLLEMFKVIDKNKNMVEFESNKGTK
jgi:hypothetical protein